MAVGAPAPPRAEKPQGIRPLRSGQVSGGTQRAPPRSDHLRSPACGGSGRRGGRFGPDPHSGDHPRPRAGRSPYRAPDGRGDTCQLLCLFGTIKMNSRLLALLPLLLPSTLHAATLGDEVQAFLNVAAVSGRERPAADFIAGRLPGLPATRDALGNVVLTVGSGEPRRLLACALGEPGFIVSAIQEDGLLRAVPGGGPVGALWTQSFEGQTVVIGGAQGWRPGAVVLPSVHLRQGGGPRERPFSVEDLYIDVGAASALEVAAMGIRLMDPVALIRRPMRLQGGLVAAPAAARKGACVALADVARRSRSAPGTGTVVFAWTVSDEINRSGLQHVTRERGPFQEALLMDS